MLDEQDKRRLVFAIRDARDAAIAELEREVRYNKGKIAPENLECIHFLDNLMARIDDFFQKELPE